ncbi:hypothetical protein OO007_13245 [Cocleimonas sp. KMM 6892]|uniref:hypothetical protein n=1 Tax=unclassified Cocleimonas TaxID=2639732 RepID=UPI002DBE21CB|nr:MULTISPECIES: hypothetical protein [unclassified Cocleimonas]MEB8433198.1 hypothetical protein [Cocleimonas sp. KMM 6892]MEC4715821.1 hypothetical protein [Cocleimonas sp. KMM 6895]MEC4745282.1 hypothetical protein [Cocleimonas sp. KMM 6896]
MNLPLLFSFSPSWLTQGLQHPVLTPSHAILLCSLAFLIGQQSKLPIHISLLFISSIAGMLLNYFVFPGARLELLLLGMALIIGLLVVIRIKQLPPLMLIISLLLATLTGLFIGIDSQPISIPGLRTNSVINWHLGAVITITLSTLILSLIAQLLRRFGDGIVLRVLGSWVATSALITLTLQYAKI